MIVNYDLDTADYTDKDGEFLWSNSWEATISLELPPSLPGPQCG